MQNETSQPAAGECPRDYLRRILTFETLDRCPVCGSGATVFAFSKRDDFLEIGFDIHRCADCTAHFVNPRVARKHLHDLYADSYYKGENWDSDTNYLANYDRSERLAELKRMYVKYYELMRARIGKPAPRILDAGAGLGLFSQAVREHHPEADIVALDPSAFAVEHLRSLGLQAVHSELETYEADAPFDGVFMREVLEHLYDPKLAVMQIARQLKPGGLFFYTTGNTDEIADLHGWGYVRPVGHIVYYNPRSAERLLRDCGLAPYPRELLRLGARRKIGGAFKWLAGRLGLRSRELPVGLRRPGA